jgi:hypothetical protein
VAITPLSENPSSHFAHESIPNVYGILHMLELVTLSIFWSCLQSYHLQQENSLCLQRLGEAVISNNPYMTKELHHGSTPVLRGIFLEYHPNGTLQVAIQAPRP